MSTTLIAQASSSASSSSSSPWPTKASRLHYDAVEHVYDGNICRIRININVIPTDIGGICCAKTRRIQNIRNCDIFMDQHTLLFFSDVRLYRLHSHRKFDMKDLRSVIVKYSSRLQCYELDLPCMPSLKGAEDITKVTLKNLLERKANRFGNAEPKYDLWLLKRVTDQFRLKPSSSSEPIKFEANFDYGFASKFRGIVNSGDSTLSAICRMPEPYVTSPLQRAIDREIDELKDFSHDIYKLNFVELDIPEGHDNPMSYKFKYQDHKLTKEEEKLLHNLTRRSENLEFADSFNTASVDCGLVSILLAICYDVRTTGNEPTCESGWTRSQLTSTLIYFEYFENMKEVVISFLRRSIIYPLYRNLDLGRRCVSDAIEALQKGPAWILKQLLVTHELFINSDTNREMFNRYYIDDYIRYVHNNAYCSLQHMQVLANNLKNVLFDVFKKNLRMNLVEVERELLKEIINEMHIETGNGDNDNNAEEDIEDDSDVGIDTFESHIEDNDDNDNVDGDDEDDDDDDDGDDNNEGEDDDDDENDDDDNDNEDDEDEEDDGFENEDDATDSNSDSNSTPSTSDSEELSVIEQIPVDSKQL